MMNLNLLQKSLKFIGWESNKLGNYLALKKEAKKRMRYFAFKDFLSIKIMRKE